MSIFPAAGSLFPERSVSNPRLMSGSTSVPFFMAGLCLVGVKLLSDRLVRSGFAFDDSGPSPFVTDNQVSQLFSRVNFSESSQNRLLDSWVLFITPLMDFFMSLASTRFRAMIRLLRNSRILLSHWYEQTNATFRLLFLG